MTRQIKADTAQPQVKTPKLDPMSASALRLLAFEQEIHQLGSLAELKRHIVQQLRSMIQYEQAFLFEKKRATSSPHISQISDLDEFDRQAPLHQGLTALVKKKADDLQTQSTDIGRVADWVPDPKALHPGLVEYPYAYVAFIPLIDPVKDQKGTKAAQQWIVLFRNEAFKEREQLLLNRLAGMYAYAWQRWTKSKAHAPLWRTKRFALVSLAVAAGILAIPVPLSVLSQARVIPNEPFVLTAPFSGVIKEISVEPNQLVNQGQNLLSFEDLALKNDVDTTEKELSVAEARYNRYNATVFTDPKSAHELPLSQAEYELANVRYQFAQAQWQQSQVASPIDGLVLYSGKKDWEGKAVQVGEQILKVANPDQIAYEIDMPVKAAIQLKEGDTVQLFFDSSPLGGTDGTIIQINHTPHTTAQQTMAYRVVALPNPAEASELPHIGSLGTARLLGKEVPLAYQLLRRPISFVRQTLGI